MQITIHSSHAKDEDGKNYAFLIDSDGTVIESNVDESFGCTPVKFDTAEFIAYYGKLNSDIDVLDIGYTCDDGTQEPPEWEWRKQAALCVIFDECYPNMSLDTRIQFEKSLPDLKTNYTNDYAEYTRLLQQASN
jgi:hypothetical protein